MISIANIARFVRRLRDEWGTTFTVRVNIVVLWGEPGAQLEGTKVEVAKPFFECWLVATGQNVQHHWEIPTQTHSTADFVLIHPRELHASIDKIASAIAQMLFSFEPQKTPVKPSPWTLIAKMSQYTECHLIHMRDEGQNHWYVVRGPNYKQVMIGHGTTPEQALEAAFL